MHYHIMPERTFECYKDKIIAVKSLHLISIAFGGCWETKVSLLNTSLNLIFIQKKIICINASAM